MGRSSRLHAYKLDQRGLARVLGGLEAAVMEAVWRLGEARVADVCAELGREANYKTVMTVMNRLVDKRLLVRRRQSRAFAYRAAESREAFLERVSQCVVASLVSDFGDLAVAQFVEELDRVDPALLERLERLVHARMAGGGDA
jgi:predicted transcriptional regulator